MSGFSVSQENLKLMIKYQLDRENDNISSTDTRKEPGLHYRSSRTQDGSHMPVKKSSPYQQTQFRLRSCGRKSDPKFDGFASSSDA